MTNCRFRANCGMNLRHGGLPSPLPSRDREAKPAADPPRGVSQPAADAGGGLADHRDVWAGVAAVRLANTRP
jgi:hypothetical protein